MDIKLTSSFTDKDFSDLDIATLEDLEDFIVQANQRAEEVHQTGQGNLLVEDAVYDNLVEVLRENAPDSPALTDLWEHGVRDTDELDVFLPKHPMKSITTIKELNLSAYQDFLRNLPVADNDQELEIITEAKLNGHGIRVIYQNGDFIRAYSRARNSKGHDLTDTLRVVLQKYNLLHIEMLEESPITEIRGELIMNSNVFEANHLAINAVSPLFAVASLSRDSATDKEHAMLDFIPYRLYMTDDGQELEFDSRQEEFDTLRDLGFYENSPELPYTINHYTKNQLSNPVFVTEMTNRFFAMLEKREDFGYYSDGMVLEINPTDQFSEMGADIKYDLGNVALKIGEWYQDSYTGYAQMIRWTTGKNKMTPTAVIANRPEVIEFDYDGEHYDSYDALDEVLDIENYPGDLWNLVSNKDDLGVLTANGANVIKVPLYEPANILLLGLTINAPINFRFGAEAGVIPLTPDNKLLTE